MTQPAVFLMNKLGDQLLGLPAIRALCTVFPGGLQLLLGEGMLSFFYRDLPVGEPVRLWWTDVENDRIDVVRAARSAKPCDLFLCVPGHAESCAVELARMMGASRTIGYSERFDDRVAIASRVHCFDRLFSLPQYFEPLLRFEQFCEPPPVSPAAESAAARFISLACASSDRILFVHPETLPDRTWPSERFSWVLKRFLAERPEYMVLVSSLAPVDFQLEKGRLVQTDAHLELVLAMMKHADLYLGVDSCFLHAADLFRVPGVALFGPTPPAFWGFRLSPFSRDVAARCMEEIRPESVLEALLAVAGDVAGQEQSKRMQEAG